MQSLLLNYWPHGVTMVGAVALGGAVVKTTRWLYARQRRRDQVFDFVESMATNHLPHIYATLQDISLALGLTPAQAPAISEIPKEDL